MNTARRYARTSLRQRRNGKVSIDIVLSLSVFFTIAMILFMLGAFACDRLHHVISILVGYPYS